MTNEEIKLKPCPRCGGEAAYRGHYSLRIYGTVWVASVWCRECYAYIERMVSKREIDLANLSDSEMIKNTTREKAIEAWNAWNRREKDA